jgi:phosphoserine phosphatase/putative flippase GtrA
MNVYDFDKTIYAGDSSIDFTLFCYRYYPNLLKCILYQLKGVFLYTMRKIEKTEMKEMLFSYLREIDELSPIVEAFWKKNNKKIKTWYLEQKRSDDLIISASPEFLLMPICEQINVQCLASVVDEKSGRFLKLNCYGEEKVRRLREKYPLEKIQQVYSDSGSDKPLVEIADKAYMVKGEKCILWQNYRPSKMEKIKTSFLNMQFIVFIFCGSVNVFNGIAFAWLYSLFIDVNLAFSIGYITSLVISYFMNSILTFHKSISIKRFVKFTISYIPNFIIQNLIVFLMYNMLMLPKIFSYGVAAIIGVPVTFIMMKMFAFSK